MNDLEISEYMRTHGGLVKMALHRIVTRLTHEDLQDASQELYITMLKCLRNYNPARKTPLDSYVAISLNRRASNVLRDKQNTRRGGDKKTCSIWDKQGDSVIFDLIYDPSQESRFDDIEQVREWMGKIEEPTQSILWMRAKGYTLEEIGQKYNLTKTWVAHIIRDGTERLREVANGS